MIIFYKRYVIFYLFDLLIFVNYNSWMEINGIDFVLLFLMEEN